MKRWYKTLGCVLLLAIAFTVAAIWSRQSSQQHRAVLAASHEARSGNEGQMAQAYQTLQAFGTTAVPILTDQITQSESWILNLRHKTSPIFPRSWRAKWQSVYPGRDPIADKLDALQGLSVLGTNAAAAVPAMERALDDKDIRIGRWAAIALGHAGPASLPSLLRASHHTNALVRANAYSGLCLLGTNAAPAIPNAIAALADQDMSVRVQANNCLGTIGVPAIEALGQAFVATNEITRAGAVHLLQRFASDTTSTELIGALSDAAPSVRLTAAQALGVLGRFVPEALPHLEKLLADPSESVRIAASNSIAAIRAAKGTPRP